MNGIDAIAAERRRQVEAEGWTPEHDDEHDAGELATAGSAYALNAACLLSPHNGTAIDSHQDLPMVWPWDEQWWKPTMDMADTKGIQRDLERAGALIAAEWDRLERQKNRQERVAERQGLREFDTCPSCQRAIPVGSNCGCWQAPRFSPITSTDRA